MQATKQSPATQGALISVFPESRDAVVKALEAMYDGKNSKEALDEAAKATDRAISISARTSQNKKAVSEKDTAFFRDKGSKMKKSYLFI